MSIEGSVSVAGNIDTDRGITAEQVTRFHQLFWSDRNHGSYDPTRASDDSQRPKKYWSLSHPGGLTEAQVRQHLTGAAMYGACPLLLDNTVRWAALDIDAHIRDGEPAVRVDRADLTANVKALGIPAIVCRSKSGGGHVLVFFPRPVPAVAARQLLARWRGQLGLDPGVELFPKQDKAGPKGQANWINCPYTPDGQRAADGLDLGQFLDEAERLRSLTTTTLSPGPPKVETPAPTEEELKGQYEGRKLDARYWRELSRLRKLRDGERHPGYTSLLAEDLRHQPSYRTDAEIVRLAEHLYVDTCEPSNLAGEVASLALSIWRMERAKRPSSQADGAPSAHLVTESFAALSIQPVYWLWKGWLAFGKTNITEGLPGVNKSTLQTDIAARASRGSAMPDGSPIMVPGPGGTSVPAAGPIGTVFSTYEDDYRDTVLPRFLAAGGDPAYADAVFATKRGDIEDLVTLPVDLDLVREKLVETNAKLICIDPMVAAISGKVDSHKDHEIRRVLAPLAKLASDLGVVVWGIRHLKKASELRAINAGGASVGLGAAARSVMVVDFDPEDEPGPAQQRVLASVKMNLGRQPESLVFAVDEVSVVHKGVTVHGVPKLRWLGTSGLTADGLAQARTEGVKDKREKPDPLAVSLLKEWLKEGGLSYKEVAKRAAGNGVSRSALYRASKSLGVDQHRTGFGTETTTTWQLPVVPVVTKADLAKARF